MAHRTRRQRHWRLGPGSFATSPVVVHTGGAEDHHAAAVDRVPGSARAVSARAVSAGAASVAAPGVGRESPTSNGAMSMTAKQIG